MSWDIEWPSLEDVSVAFVRTHYSELDAEEFGAYARLVWTVAIESVNNRYRGSRANTCSLPNDETLLARMAWVTKRKWNKIRPAVIKYFELRGDRWYLLDETVIRISRRSVRNPIPMAVKMAALGRRGERCAYCGTDEGPFHFDHLYPVAKGGGDDPNNIVVACQSCNLSKKDRTILEWVEYLLRRAGDD